MEDNKEFNEEEYIEFVNYGYYLSKYAPDMADLIVHAKGSSSKLEALHDGREIFLDEEFDDIKPDWLKDHDYDKETKKTKDLNRDIEPDI
jgi:hypothetical protein